ncbi:MAG TPA: DUF4279 domain-containing protein [Segetibacter sp.]|nr:DUF4279 domain-containing protein [Segetibacter sp.]
MTNEILQDFTFYDYSDVEIEYSIKTRNFSLTYIADILKVNPTRGFNFGDKYEGKQLNTDTKQIESIIRQKPFTLWSFNSNSLTKSNRFEEHATQLLSLLTARISDIDKLLADKDSFEIIIFIYLTFDQEEKHFGFGSTSTLFRQLADISHYIEWRTK